MFSIAPLVAANFVLDDFAESQARAELRGMAERYVARGEKAINDAFMVLQRLSRDGVVSCSMADRAAFRTAVAGSPFVQKVGVVDTAGVRMCIVPDQPVGGDAILPALTSDAPLVGIGMMAGGFEGTRVALVSWRLDNGNRIFAELSPAAISIDPGPDYLRAFRRAELRLGDDVVWLTSGETESLDGAEMAAPMVETASSKKYPLAAVVSAPSLAAKRLVRDLKVIAALCCGGFAVLFIGVSVWFSWRPDSEVEDEFVQAIRNGEFIPYYQPVMDIENGRLRGCEVLMRWQRPDGSLVSPGLFMPFAETSGHIFEMTRNLMKKTCEEIGDLYHENPEFKLSINLFAGHFDDRQIIDDIKAIYGRSQIAYQQIVVEVTERQPLSNMETARKIIAELQSLGVRVALDDVGTGHGGLAYLQKLGIDIIKIDKMFIDAIGSESNSGTIIETLVDLARNMRMEIIAEGVERFDQVIYLRDLGIRSAQGHVFAPPLPTSSYLKLIEAADPIPAPSEEEKEERAARRLRAAG